MSVASLIFCATSVLSMPGDEPDAADLVIVNANVITVRSTRPRAEAFAVRAGKFVAVGSERDVRPLIGKGTAVLDLAGGTVVPGFNDAHAHPSPVYPDDSPFATAAVGPDAVRTIDDLIALLRRKAERTPAGVLVTGRGYQETKLGRHPTRHDLDQASTRHPIYLTHSSGHLTAVNSKALELAGVTKATPDPTGGSFDREPDGTPSGVCRERAASLVRRAAPEVPKPSRAEAVAGLLCCFNKMAAQGVTSIGDAGINPDKLALYRDARSAGLSMRVYAMLRESHLDDLIRIRDAEGLGDEHLKLGAVKLFHGNSLSGRTCWLSEPYVDKAGGYGIPPARSQKDLDALILAVHQAGFQAAVHSNGDREIDMVLTAIERAQERSPRRNARHRIEHASVALPPLLERAKKLGVVLALHSYIYEHGDKMEPYGAYRWGLMHPSRSALDLGIAVAGTSDYPVSAAEPLLRIQDLATRRSAEGKVYGPQQIISPAEAIAVWTLGSAYASFEETTKGSIEPGKLADFVVLAADPTRCTPEEIRKIPVERTYIGGQCVYRNGR
jgi:predicted amidohydrolase YtcJ